LTEVFYFNSVLYIRGFTDDGVFDWLDQSDDRVVEKYMFPEPPLVEIPKSTYDDLIANTEHPTQKVSDYFATSMYDDGYKLPPPLMNSKPQKKKWWFNRNMKVQEKVEHRGQSSDVLTATPRKKRWWFNFCVCGGRDRD
jgi:hypothetical protein